MIYVILAHNCPKSLQRLILKLSEKRNYFVIHIDKNIDINPFLKVTKEIERCHFTNKRYATNWGSFALVEATLHAFDYIRTTLRKRQRIVLLSGADYPIKSKIFIHEYLQSHKDTIFINYEKIPLKRWYNGGIFRFPAYYEIKKEINFYGGSQWFSIPPKALTILFNFLDYNPSFLEYFRHVTIPDESFFQTLFLNCDHPYILNNLRNHNLHHIKWDYPYLHPRIFTIKYFNQLKKSKSLFSRKFDPKQSKEILSKLDQQVIKNT